MIHDQLSQLAEMLKKDGFSIRLVKEDEQSPTEQLWILSPTNQREIALSWRLEVTLLPKLALPNVLQFIFPLPFQVAVEAVPTLARFISEINRCLPLPGFGMSESNGWVYYRYLLACSDQSLDTVLILNIIHMIFFVIDQFGTLVGDVAEGRLSMDQALDQLHKKLA